MLDIRERMAEKFAIVITKTQLYALCTLLLLLLIYLTYHPSTTASFRPHNRATPDTSPNRVLVHNQTKRIETEMRFSKKGDANHW